MKRIALTLLILTFGALVGNLQAQQLKEFKEQLAKPVIDSVSLRMASIHASEEPAAADVLVQIERSNTRSRFQGWRVCIFSDNTAEARSKAHAAMESFREHFAEIPLYNEYASPYFRVSVGNCTTAEEAIILLNRVNKIFPKAFIKQESLTLSDLLK